MIPRSMPSGLLTWVRLTVAIAAILTVSAAAGAQVRFDVLHEFGCSGIDGLNPKADLVEALDGNFYGTTQGGGYPFPDGFGTIFRITPDGTYTVVHRFNGPDGAFPTSALIQATDGNFYGTADEGGYGGGTIFRMTPDGTVTVLHAFNGDTALPSARLIQATDGNFYGPSENRTEIGNCGAIFRLSTSP